MNLKLGPFRLYSHHLSDYLRRWALQTPIGTIRLHHILRPDADPDMHDHPWDFASLILWGGYTEEIPLPGKTPHEGLQLQTFVPGSVNFRRASDPHRIVELPHGSSWSLLFSGVRIRPWGFWAPQGWVPWQDYVEHSQKGVDPAAYRQRLQEVGVSE